MASAGKCGWCGTGAPARSGSRASHAGRALAQLLARRGRIGAPRAECLQKRRFAGGAKAARGEIYEVIIAVFSYS